jgi:hypothetical protein
MDRVIILLKAARELVQGWLGTAYEHGQAFRKAQSSQRRAVCFIRTKIGVNHIS